MGIDLKHKFFINSMRRLSGSLDNQHTTDLDWKSRSTQEDTFTISFMKFSAANLPKLQERLKFELPGPWLTEAKKEKGAA